MTSADRHSAMIDSWATGIRNREAFLLNNRDAVVRFGELHSSFESAWRLLGSTRDAQGRSHVGLLTLVPVFERQLVVGFNTLACHQCQMAWLAIRPGLEALLFLGVWADDPDLAQTWRDWDADRTAFMKAFGGKALKKTSFPSAAALSSVMSEINDRYAHPNPLFVSHGEVVTEEADFVEMMQSFFDGTQTVEAHLLAYLSLLEVCLICSADFIKNHIVISGAPDPPPRRIPTIYEDRAAKLIAADETAGPIIEDLGLWGW